MSTTTYDYTALDKLATDTISFFVGQYSPISEPQSKVARLSELPAPGEATVQTESCVSLATFLLALRKLALFQSELRLDEIGRLERDWDSYGGEPPSLLAVLTSRIILNLLDKRVPVSGTDHFTPYSIAPLASGGVQIEWRADSDVIEVEVGSDGKVSYLHIHDHTTREKSALTLADLLDEIVSVVC